MEVFTLVLGLITVVAAGYGLGPRPSRWLNSFIACVDAVCLVAAICDLADLSHRAAVVRQVGLGFVNGSPGIGLLGVAECSAAVLISLMVDGSQRFKGGATPAKR